LIAKYKHIIWDWNGTLLDDVSECLAVLHELLQRRGLPLLTQEQYRARFDFPVIEFYVEMGFDLEKESFDDIAQEYHAGYVEKVNQCRLQASARDVLHAFDDAGLTQSLLSAYQRERLKEAVAYFNLDVHFTKLIGMNDYYAHSKVENGKRWVNEMVYDPDEILFIGDTCHDFEVAQAMGTDCILVTFGHQNRDRLALCGVPRLDSLAEVQQYVLS